MKIVTATFILLFPQIVIGSIVTFTKMKLTVTTGVVIPQFEYSEINTTTTDDAFSFVRSTTAAGYNNILVDNRHVITGVNPDGNQLFAEAVAAGGTFGITSNYQGFFQTPGAFAFASIDASYDFEVTGLGAKMRFGGFGTGEVVDLNTGLPADLVYNLDPDRNVLFGALQPGIYRATTAYYDATPSESGDRGWGIEFRADELRFATNVPEPDFPVFIALIVAALLAKKVTPRRVC